MAKAKRPPRSRSKYFGVPSELAKILKLFNRRTGLPKLEKRPVKPAEGQKQLFPPVRPGRRPGGGEKPSWMNPPAPSAPIGKHKPLPSFTIVPPRPALPKLEGAISGLSKKKRAQALGVVSGHAPLPDLEGMISRPARKPRKPAWKETIAKPEGFKRLTPETLPSIVEAVIDVQFPGMYHLNRAAEHAPDHDLDWTCHHPKSASSWVSCIALVVLSVGKLGVLASFWRPDGATIVYTFSKDDDAIGIFLEWRAAPSKGKWLKRMLYQNPYVRA